MPKIDLSKRFDAYMSNSSKGFFSFGFMLNFYYLSMFVCLAEASSNCLFNCLKGGLFGS